jgi:hypothetical protein
MNEGEGYSVFLWAITTRSLATTALHNNLDDALSTPTCHPTPLPAGANNAIGGDILI